MVGLSDILLTNDKSEAQPQNQIARALGTEA